MPFEHSAFARALSLAVHELRTPVTVTAGYVRMLLREQAGPVSDRQRTMLEEAERSCGRLNALITEMRARLVPGVLHAFRDRRGGIIRIVITGFIVIAVSGTILSAVLLWRSTRARPVAAA